MGFRLTIEEARSLGIDVDALLGGADAPAPQPEATPKRAKPADGPNKTELRFQRRLEQYKHDGRIRDFKFEPEKLRLAGRCWYTPDWRVELLDRSILFAEIKGGFAREDALIKLKVCADIHACYDFKIFRYDRKTGWTCRDVTRTGFGAEYLWEP